MIDAATLEHFIEDRIAIHRHALFRRVDDLRIGKQIFDQRRHALCAGLNIFQILVGLLIQLPFVSEGEKLRKAGDHAQWFLQIVGGDKREALEVRIRPFQILHGLFQRLAVVLRFDVQEADFQTVVDARQELGLLKRFADEIPGSGFERAQLVARLRGNDEDRQVAPASISFRPSITWNPSMTGIWRSSRIRL
jgi:hypothetical protein